MLIIFLHIIWHLLAGSGLQELLKMVYPGNTTKPDNDWHSCSHSSAWPHAERYCTDTILVADTHNNVPVATQDEVEDHIDEMTIADLGTDYVEHKIFHDIQ